MGFGLRNLGIVGLVLFFGTNVNAQLAKRSYTLAQANAPQYQVEAQLSSKVKSQSTSKKEEIPPIFVEGFSYKLELESAPKEKPAPVFEAETHRVKDIFGVEASPFRVYDKGTVLRGTARHFIPRNDFVTAKVEYDIKKVDLGPFKFDNKLKLRGEGVMYTPTLSLNELGISLEPRLMNGELEEVNVRFKAYKGEGIISFRSNDKFPVTAGFICPWPKNRTLKYEK